MHTMYFVYSYLCQLLPNHYYYVPSQLLVLSLPLFLKSTSCTISDVLMSMAFGIPL